MQTTQRSERLSTTIRSFAAADYDDVTRVLNLNFVEFSMTADELRFDDSQRTAPCLLARWVAECHGRIIGFAQYEQSPYTYHPRKFQLNICVDPAYHCRGVGRQLYDLVLIE